MDSSPPRRAASALSLLLLAYMAVLLFVRLADFPGLHGDEAWVGFFSMRLGARGLYTPHEMNTYTGALYAWLVKDVFAWFGPGVWSLRLPGAVLNVAAWGLLWRVAAAAAGPWAGAAWCALGASSAIVVLKSRVAWEVYALQPLLLAAVLASCRRLADGEGGGGAALTLFAASLLGVQNHFIFLSIPIVLVVAGGVLYERGREERWLDFLQLALVNMLPCLLLFFFKPMVSEASWPRLEVPLLAAFALLPALALAASRTAPRWRPALAALFEHPRASAAAPWLERAFMALLFGFFWFHWVALIEIQSGVVVLARLASMRLPWPAEALLYAWAAALLCGTLIDGFGRLRDGGRGLKPSAVLLAVLPPLYAAVFILFRNTSSIRYYALPSQLLLLAAAGALARRPAFRRPAVLAGLCSGGLALNALFWCAVLGREQRPPFRFRVGWHKEKSYDFIGKDDLFAAFEAGHLCKLVQEESMIDLPLLFRFTLSPAAGCDPSKAARTQYCWDCSSPPYIKTTVVAAP